MSDFRGPRDSAGLSPDTQPLTLALMAGLSGTGKTTLAQALGSVLGWPVVDKDTLKSAVLAAGAPEQLAGPASYELLLDMGEDLLVRQGLNVLLDSPCLYPQVLTRARAIAERAGASLRILRCRADQQVRERRLGERVTRLSQLTAHARTTDEQEREHFIHLPSDALVLDSNQPLGCLIEQALAYLLDCPSHHAPAPSVQIATVLLVDRAGHLLLQHRAADAARAPNRWGLPGGHMEPGESAQAAARRELAEESGLTLVDPLFLFWRGLRPSLSRAGDMTEWHVFYAPTQARQEDLICGEGQALRFVAPKEALALDLAPSEAYLVPLFLASRAYQLARAGQSAW